MNCSQHNLPRGLGVRETGATRRAVRGDTVDREERPRGRRGAGRRSSWVGVARWGSSRGR